VLDLGDMLYAPNCFRDGGGRHVMVAWLQEHASRQTSFDYSGCITLPRVLTLAGAQQPCRYLDTCNAKRQQQACHLL